MAARRVTSARRNSSRNVDRHASRRAGHGLEPGHRNPAGTRADCARGRAKSSRDNFSSGRARPFAARSYRARPHARPAFRPATDAGNGNARALAAGSIARICPRRRAASRPHVAVAARSLRSAGSGRVPLATSFRIACAGNLRRRSGDARSFRAAAFRN